MTSAGKWVLGLLLLVVGAVFVARTVSSDPGSQAQVKLPAAESAGAAKDTEEEKAKAAAEAAAKKVAGTVAGDVACKKACIEVNEVANDAVTTAKLAPGSVTLSKLAFEVPNLNELENEINARKATEAALKAANAEAAAAGAKNDAAITAAASNGITAEAAARAAADEALAKNVAAADATLLGNINKEIADRTAADDVLQGKLNTEIADRAGAISSLRGELANPNSVGAPILAINNNEIVTGAVQSNSILDRTITAQDLGIGSVTTVEILNGTIKGEDVTTTDADALTGANIKNESLNAVDINTDAVDTSEIKAGAVKEDELDTASVSTDKLVDASNDSSAPRGVTTAKIENRAVTFDKLDDPTRTRITDLESGLAQEIQDREDAITAEALARSNADSDLQDAIDAEAIARGDADDDLQDAIDAEGVARIAGDATLQSAIGAEELAREAADLLLTQALDDFKDALLLTGPVTPDNPALVDFDRIANVPADIKNKKASDLDCVPQGTTCVQDDEIESVSGSKVDGAVAEADLASDLDCATCVSNGELAGNIDFAKLDAATIIIDASMLAVGFEISGGQITDGTIGAADLAGEYDADPNAPEVTVGAVTSEKIADGTILARDLADGAVTGLKIADGTIEGVDLKDGAVSANKLQSNVVLATDAALPLAVPPVGDDVPATGDGLVVTGDPHKVLVTGQVQITCDCTLASGETASLQYQLIRMDDGGGNEKAITPLYEVTVTEPAPMSMPISLSGVDEDVPDGKYVYKIRLVPGLANTGGYLATGAMVTAVDLGRA